MSSHRSNPCSRPEIMTAATPASASPVPTEPMSRSVLRPTRSMIDMPTSVAARLVNPIATDCRSAESALNPAALKISPR